MLNSKAIQNVIKLAGKVEDPATSFPIGDPAEATPPEKEEKPGVGAPAQEDVPETKTLKAPEQSLIVYFFSAPENRAIDFANISTLLKSPEIGASLVENLMSKSGTPAPYSAGYFSWLAVHVITNKKEYNNGSGKYVVYTAELDSKGNLQPGSEELKPSSDMAALNNVKEGFNVFKNGIVNLQTTSSGGSKVIYYRGKPPNYIDRMLANPSAAPDSYFGGGPKIAMDYNTFVNSVADYFRIWVPEGGGEGGYLVRPDTMTRPGTDKRDGVPGNYYQGGESFFKKVIVPMLPDYLKKNLSAELTERPKAPSPEESSKLEKSQFQAVGEKREEPMKGQYLDNPPGGTRMASEESTKGDYAKKPYSGGFDVMKRLVKDQHECMKIRKCAKNVVLGYLKEAQYSTVMPGTQSQTTGTNPDAPAAFYLGKTVQKSKQNKKDMEEAIKLQEKQLQIAQRSTQRSTQPMSSPAKI